MGKLRWREVIAYPQLKGQEQNKKQLRFMIPGE
ncbi:hypothetical protein Q9966_000909 [Columba livia]|nr:hypothetical protein Q9966_000909 [Columba livia]